MASFDHEASAMCGSCGVEVWECIWGSIHHVGEGCSDEPAPAPAPPEPPLKSYLEQVEEYDKTGVLPTTNDERVMRYVGDDAGQP